VTALGLYPFIEVNFLLNKDSVVVKKTLLSMVFVLLFCQQVQAQLMADPAHSYVVIVGVCEWKGELTKFSKKHRKDAELQAYFKKAGVPSANITALYDASATLKNMNKALANAGSKAAAKSTIVFYYAGHGLSVADNIYFANYDVDTEKTSTAFNLDQIHKVLSRSKARNIILLADCCYSGGLIKQAARLVRSGKRVLTLTSAAASNLSTGNWTFSQTLLDCLNGSANADHNGNKSVSLEETHREIYNAMKYRERQRSGFSAHGFPKTMRISKVKTPIKSFPEKGKYYWTKHKDIRVPVRVTDTSSTDFICEFYFYSDKVYKRLTAKQIQAIHFVNHKVGARVLVKWRKRWYKATVLKTKNDFCYIKYDEDDDSWNEWVLYDRVRTGKEKKVQVLDDGAYYPAYILEERAGSCYVRYENYAAFWDAWVSKDRIKQLKNSSK
jgi:hypothetical protein